MPPQIDADHRGPLINLVAWITLVPMVLFVVAKVSTKWRMAAIFQLDDSYMIFGMLIAVAQAINTTFQVNSGLGQHEDDLTTGQFDRFQKTTYISQVLYLITISFAKFAPLQFLIALTVARTELLVIKGILGLVALWLLISIICVCFQCDLPSPWNQATGRCFDQQAFWTANSVMDIFTQLLISFLPIYLFFYLQMSADRKRKAMFAFSPNIFTIPLIVIRLDYIYKSSSNTTDLSFTNFKTALISELHTNCSIIISCIPFMRALVESLAIGLMTNEIRIPAEDTAQSGSDPNSGRDTINPFALLSGRGYNTRNVYGWSKSKEGKQTATFTSTIEGGQSKSANTIELTTREDGGGYGSQERMVISQTKTTIVTSEPVS